MFIALIKYMCFAYDQWNYDAGPAIFSDVARNCYHGPFQLRTHVEHGLARTMIATRTIRTR
ncbi:hypothetical protein TomMM35A_13780 [Sphingobium sp. TomMM35A]